MGDNTAFHLLQAEVEGSFYARSGYPLLPAKNALGQLRLSIADGLSGGDTP